MEVVANGVRLWVERHGGGSGRPVLLIAGADATGRRWTPAVVDPLIDAGCGVVVYDHRDVGRSQVMAPEEPYRLDDLAADAVAVLDDLDIGAAHLVGRSMGGMIAQLIALDHPRYAASLTLIGTTPGLGDERLPAARDDVVDELAARLWQPPPSDRQARIDWVVDGQRLFAGSGFAFEEEMQRELATAEVDEHWNPETGHGVAVGASPSRLDRLGEIDVPTLIVHGSEDGVFAPEHARALHEGIAGSELWMVDGLGHELPDALAPDLTARLLAFWRRS